MLAEDGCLSAAVAHFGERGECAGLAEEGGDLPALNVAGVAPVWRARASFQRRDSATASHVPVVFMDESQRREAAGGTAALPGVHGIVHRILNDSHRCLASRFPFAIYYRVEGDVVRVRAVLDCRRNPAWIRRRVQG